MFIINTTGYWRLFHADMWDDENRLGTVSSFVFWAVLLYKELRDSRELPPTVSAMVVLYRVCLKHLFQMNRNLFGGLDGKKDNNECSIFLFHQKKDSVIIYLFTLMTFQTCMTYFFCATQNITFWRMLVNKTFLHFTSLVFFIQQKSMGNWNSLVTNILQSIFYIQ